MSGFDDNPGWGENPTCVDIFWVDSIIVCWEFRFMAHNGVDTLKIPSV